MTSELVRGKTIPLGDLVRGVNEGGNATDDMDKLLNLLDKAEKLLNNPLVQQFLGIRLQTQEPKVEYVEKIPENALVPRSELHNKIFKTLNRMDDKQLVELFRKYGGKDVEKVLEHLSDH